MVRVYALITSLDSRKTPGIRTRFISYRGLNVVHCGRPVVVLAVLCEAPAEAVVEGRGHCLARVIGEEQKQDLPDEYDEEQRRILKKARVSMKNVVMWLKHAHFARFVELQGLPVTVTVLGRRKSVTLSIVFQYMYKEIFFGPECCHCSRSVTLTGVTVSGRPL